MRLEKKLIYARLSSNYIRPIVHLHGTSLGIFVRAWTITELSSQYKTQLFITRPSVRVMIYPQVADNFCTIYLDQCNISSYYCFNALKSRHALKLLSSFKFIHTSIWWYFWMVRWGNDKRTFVSMHIILVTV